MVIIASSKNWTWGVEMKGNPNHGIPVTEKEANEIYLYWISGKNGQKRQMSDVARRFNRARGTIYQIRKRFGWDKRYAGSIAKLEKETNKAVEKKIETTRELMRGAFLKMAKAVLDPQFILTVETIEDFSDIVGKFTILGRALLELEGELPSEQNRNSDLHLHIDYDKLPKDERDRRIFEWAKVFGSQSGDGGGNSRL